MSNTALERLIWVLIYGGLLLLSLGVFVRESPAADSAWLGLAFIGVGALLALAGAVLVWVRARRDPPR